MIDFGHYIMHGHRCWASCTRMWLSKIFVLTRADDLCCAWFIRVYPAFFSCGVPRGGLDLSMEAN
jgi:hypothetical protein